VTTWLIPIGATIAAAALTYLFCVRPMRHGQHCMMPGDQATQAASGEPGLAEEIRQAHAELTRLRREAGTSPTADPAPAEPK
jgi:hypothetical protein